MNAHTQTPPLDPFDPGVRGVDVPVAAKSDLSRVLFPEEPPDVVAAPALIARPRDLSDLRLKLRTNGYHPVPLIGAHIKTKSAGKRPSMPAWQDKCLNADPDEITGWSRDRVDDTNTGLLCGEIVGVDIDVLDADLSAKLAARAQELFGPSALRRIGRAPKVLFVYRVETPHDKLATPTLIFGDDTEDQSAWAKVEILANGQQFVAYGIHPDTRQLYHWPEQSLLDTHASDVPLVTLDLLQQFVTEADQVLRDAGARTKAEIEAANPVNAPSISQRAAALVTASRGAVTGSFPADGETFFKKVNALALASLSSWVPVLFPTARPYNGGYRIESKDLGRVLEEDLSILPIGIKDWGVWDEGDPRLGKRTSIDVVMGWSGKTASEAALWLCDQLKMPPEALGWNRVEGESTPDAVPTLTAQQKPIHATPYAWKDPATIRRREWLYGHLLLRKFVSATVSPGGIGKSSLIATEALAMVSGKPLLGVSPDECLRVWLWNLEDPQEETERKIQAAALHYEQSHGDIGDRLLVDSGRDQKLVIARTERNGTVIVQPVVDSIVAEIIARKIDVIIIDPFVSCHEAAENDNPAMDMVVKEWGRVADRGNCAVHLVHHTRKMGDGEVNTESSRGGSAQTDACRVVRAINRMTKAEATNAGVDNPRSYFRTLNDKANLQPPTDKSDWFKLESVYLGNGPMGMPGDSVGVVTEWQWPDLTVGMTAADYDKVAAVIRSGKWKDSIQAKNWAGNAVAEALGLDPKDPADKARIKATLRMYIGAGTLVVVERFDDEQRKLKKFVEAPEEA
jgi:AAA domain/Bifunctional DNA primase/polymerase, N-terminal